MNLPPRPCSGEPGISWHLRLARRRGPRPPAGDELAREIGRLRSAALRRGCAVHAYVLLAHRLELLVTGLLTGSVAALVRDLTRGRNATGADSAWALCVARVVADHDVLATMRGIDRVPMREGLVTSASAWQWSSHHACVAGTPDRLACPHAAYLALARNRNERRQRYRGQAMATDAPGAARDTAQGRTVAGVRGLSRLSFGHPGRPCPPA